MNQKGKKKIVKKLTTILDEWLDTANLNESAETDIGYVSNRTAELMALAAVTILESNSDLIAFVIKEEYLK